MTSNVRLFGDDLVRPAILATDYPREQNRPDRQVHHFDHDFWQKDCANIVPQGNIAKFSQKDEICGLPSDPLANVASRKPVLMISCGTPLPLILGVV